MLYEQLGADSGATALGGPAQRRSESRDRLAQIVDQLVVKLVHALLKAGLELIQLGVQTRDIGAGPVEREVTPHPPAQAKKIALHDRGELGVQRAPVIARCVEYGKGEIKLRFEMHIEGGAADSGRTLWAASQADKGSAVWGGLGPKVQAAGTFEPSAPTSSAAGSNDTRQRAASV